MLAILLFFPLPTETKDGLIALFFALQLGLLGREILASEKGKRIRAILIGSLAFWFIASVALIAQNPLAVIYPDSLDYLRAAGQAGEWPWHAVRGPFYPLFIRGAAWVFGRELFPLIVLQNLICCFGLFGVWKAARSGLGRWPAAILWLLLVGNLEIVLWAHSTLADSLGIFFFCILLVGILRKDVRYLILAVAVLPAIKANFAYVIPVFAGLMLYGAAISSLTYRRAVALFALGLLPTVALSIANKAHFGFGSVSNHSSLSLFWVVGNMIDPGFLPEAKSREKLAAKLNQINQAYHGNDHEKLNPVAFDKDSVTEIIRGAKPEDVEEAKLFGELANEAIRRHPFTFSYHVLTEGWKLSTYRLGGGFTEVYFNKQLPEKVEKVAPSPDTIQYRQGTVTPAVLTFTSKLLPFLFWISMTMTAIVANALIFTTVALLLCGGFLGRWDALSLTFLTLGLGHVAIHSIWNWSNGRYQAAIYPAFCLIVVRGLQYLRGLGPSVSRTRRLLTARAGVFLAVSLALYGVFRSLPLFEAPIPGMAPALQAYHQQLTLLTVFIFLLFGAFAFRTRRPHLEI